MVDMRDNHLSDNTLELRYTSHQSRALILFAFLARIIDLIHAVPGLCCNRLEFYQDFAVDTWYSRVRAGSSENTGVSYRTTEMGQALNNYEA